MTSCKPEVDHIVAIVSDSIITYSQEELSASELGRDSGDVFVPLVVIPGSALGRDVSFVTKRIESVRGRIQFDSAVVSYFTNDSVDIDVDGNLSMLQPWPYIDTQDELDVVIDQLMTALGDVPVVWLVPNSGHADPARLAYVRAGLEHARERWPKLTLLAQDPSWFEGMHMDGLHYSDEGQLEASKAIVQALDGIFGR